MCIHVHFKKKITVLYIESSKTLSLKKSTPFKFGLMSLLFSLLRPKQFQTSCSWVVFFFPVITNKMSLTFLFNGLSYFFQLLDHKCSILTESYTLLIFFLFCFTSLNCVEAYQLILNVI